MDLELALLELKDLVKQLNITEYKAELYTEYDECYYDNSKNSFSLYEVVKTEIDSYFLSLIKAVIINSFDWDYKCEAKFDVKLVGNVLDIKFHEPVIKYVISNKTFNI